MAELLGSIGSFFSSGAGKGLETIAGLGATGSGLIGNLMADQQRSAAASAAQKNMQLTPQQLSSQVSSATQPLNAGLIQAVTGNVNANLAEQGLSESPGLIATAQSQALAPFQQQNQQTAMQLVLQKLGLPAEFARTIPPNANMSQLIALLMRGSGGGTPTGTPFGGGSTATTGPNLSQLGQPDPSSVGDFSSIFPSDASNG
jgi:hypothetical protein